MQHLFTPQGEAAIAAVMRRRPVLGFDFDGTLAPIVAHPDDARIPAPVAERLQALAALRPVVVVSGRAVDDLRRRLGFAPRHIVGNHGADDPGAMGAAAHAAAGAAHVHALQPLRDHLGRHAAELHAQGITLEDKGASIALHYRRAQAPTLARALLRRLLEAPPAGVRVFAGKRVFNAVASDAPDKAHAMRDLVQRCGGDCALFCGDDVNDEPVFEQAPADWLTVRVGRARGGSQARFYIDGPRQIVGLLERALRAPGALAHR
jgi:trehalose 6-phosphate phosphatase